jgi:hypothetical protein
MGATFILAHFDTRPVVFLPSSLLYLSPPCQTPQIHIPDSAQLDFCLDLPIAGPDWMGPISG